MPQPSATRPKVLVINPGDPIPPHIPPDVLEALRGGPVFEGTDVPVEYMHEYLNRVHNLYAFLQDFPQVSRQQALQAIKQNLNENTVIQSHRDYVSGAPRFVGTRVPVYILFEWLAGGHNLDSFHESFPTVSKAQALEAITLASNALDSIAYETANDQSS